MNHLPFRYHPEILKSFPKIFAGVIVGRNVKNSPSPGELKQSYLLEQNEIIKRIGTTPLSEIESLAGWRIAFRQFGVDPTQYRSAAEALLRRLTKKGDIPSINSLVDCCNLVSIRHALPIAAFDLQHLYSPITVQFASGSENFKPLGEALSEHPDQGEVVFTDENSTVVARRWCWRQSEESAAKEETSSVLITIESQHDGGNLLIDQAIIDLHSLLIHYCTGEYQVFRFEEIINS